MKNSIEATCKKLFRSFLIPFSVFIINTTLHGQWIQQNIPAGSRGIILSVDFLNAQKGITGGWNTEQTNNNEVSGISFYTVDGGVHWLASAVPDSVRAITNIKFISDNAAYAVGAYNLPGGDAVSSFEKSFQLNQNSNKSLMGLNVSPAYSAVLLKSINGGVSWFVFGNVPDSYNYLYQLEFMDHQNLFTIGTHQSGNGHSGKLGSSTDGGNSWSDVSIPLDNGDLNCLQYNNGRIFAAGYEETSATETKGVLLISDDNGLTWTKKSYPGIDGFNDIKFTDKLTGYACSYSFPNPSNPDSKIYRTTDGGDSWNILSIDLNSVIIHKIGVCRNTGVVTISGNKSVNTPSGNEYGECVIVTSSDFGETWTSQGSAINKNVIFRESVFLDRNNAYITGYLADAGGSVPQIYHTTNGGYLNSQNPSTQNPGDFSLNQNYPNPFNPSTQISFSVSKNENVTLKVYNSSGKEIRTLLNGTQEAGSHIVTFNAQDIPSGIYFYTMAAGNYSQTRKMILLK